MNELNMENLTEVFKCFICLGNLKCAHLCPHCSQLCCYSCIQQWLVTLQRSQCPHCRKTLHLEDLINCRWVENVSEQLDALHQVEENAKKDICTTHNEKLSVFCLNCEKCICHQCALWGKIHSNHVFKPLEEVSLQHIEKIKEGLIHFRERHSKVKHVLSEIEKKLLHLMSVKNERMTEINHFMSQIKSNLENKLQQKLSTLMNLENVWSDECVKIESTINSFEKGLLTCSRSELLSTSKKITQSVSQFKGFPITSFQNLNAGDLEFPSEVIPPYENGIFVLSNFSHLQLKNVPVYSPPLRTPGSIWRLKVFPVGNSFLSRRYLSVHLELTSVFTETSKYHYKVEMVHQISGDPSNSHMQEFTSEFVVGHSWGFNRFYLLDELASQGYLANDTLILKFGVRFSSYYEKCMFQERFITQLQTARCLEKKDR